LWRAVLPSLSDTFALAPFASSRSTNWIPCLPVMEEGCYNICNALNRQNLLHNTHTTHKPICIVIKVNFMSSSMDNNRILAVWSKLSLGSPKTETEC
jgi:hypothetical protein